MSNPRIKRISHPTFTDAEMLLENPVLKIGEIVFIKDPNTFEILNFKVGDGFSAYDVLPFRDAREYPYGDPVSNTIGDVVIGSNQSGRAIADIIKDMISPYIAPAVSNVKTDADGSSKNLAQLEIGQSIGSAIGLTFSISNPENLAASTPIEVDGGSGFLVSNPYPNAPISLTPNGVLAPVSPTVYTIRVRAKDSIGNFSGYSNATVRFDTRFIWGASQLADLTTTQHALDLIPSGGQGVKQGYAGDYEFTTAGYGYILIPSVLNPVSVIFTDVTNPNTPSTVEMVNVGTLQVNNGVGIYNYEKFRTPFNNLEGSIIRAS